MSLRVLIILIVLIALLAVVASVLGVGRTGDSSERTQAKEHPPAFTAYLERALGWATPGFDLDQLQVTGATLRERRLTLAAGETCTLTVAALRKPDRSSCRSLRVAVVTPVVQGPGVPVLELTTCLLAPPLPDPDDFTPPATGTLLPNPKPAKDPLSGGIKPASHGECAIPFFSGGGRIELKAARACTLELR